MAPENDATSWNAVTDTARFNEAGAEWLRKTFAALADDYMEAKLQ